MPSNRVRRMDWTQDFLIEIRSVLQKNQKLNAHISRTGTSLCGQDLPKTGLFKRSKCISECFCGLAWSVPTALEPPLINNIADKIYFFDTVTFQEIRKQIRLICTRTQIDFRQRYCFVVIGYRVNDVCRRKLLHCKFLIQNFNTFIGKQVLQIYNAS